MTRLGLGLAAIGRPAYINLGHETDFPGGREVQDLRTQCHRLLDLAWDRGVRHFDAARSYGLAEEFLGDWLLLHPGRRSELTIGSKWGYTYVGGWRLEARTHEVKDHSLASFQRQWPETLSAIGGPPDLYLIHSLTPESTALGDRQLRDALAELAATGVR
ncbi:MAG: aldo/keto reductase, partial [Nocardioidaceae bacterium]